MVDGVEQGTTRAVVWISKDGREMVRLTSKAEANMTDNHLYELAMNRAAEMELDLEDGDLIFDRVD